MAMSDEQAGRKATAWVSVVLVSTFALAWAGCCGSSDKSGKGTSAEPLAATATPRTGSTTAATKPAAPSRGGGQKAGTMGFGVVNAPRTASNQTGRGIVRSGPDFKAAEVTRLDPGTEVNLISKAGVGWYHISWPVETDANKGYLHGDVMKVTLIGD
jgi:hypothetical protein